MYTFKFLKSVLFALLIMLSSAVLAQADLIVAQDGSGDYISVQAAINAAPTGRTVPYVIFIKNGTYREKINVPSTKPFIKLVGEEVAHVMITYDDYAAKLTSCTNTVGTQNSATFTVNANDFSAMNITFVNSFGDGSQAVAVLVNADRAIFFNCRMMANQDTLYVKGSGAPRHYFRNCYIDGNVDFIFGSAVALFDSCVVYAKSRTAAGTSYITAPNTPLGQNYGFVFRDARLPKNTGNTQYFLSRPWPSPDVAGTRQKTVFISSVMSAHIKPEGWTVWDANTNTANLYYGEFNTRNFNGAAYDVSQRVNWSYQLTATEAASYTTANIFGGWDPCLNLPELCGIKNTDLVVSNFKGTKGASSSSFSWNISWPVAGCTYTLYKSIDQSNYLPVYTVTEPTDSVINFNYTDNSIPVSGTSWRYFVTCSAPGYAMGTSDTVQISSLSQLTVNASAALQFCGFSQLLGSPSATQTYTLTGSNLTDNVTITPPSPFEISADNTNWYGNANPLVINSIGGNLSSTIIYIRLNAALVGLYAGNIINTTAGLNDIPVPLTGVTFAASTSFPLQQWPLTNGPSDSAAVRSPAVTASDATLNNLFVSDGTQPSAGPIPGYSGQYGQALGANAAGNNWSNVGGTMKRHYYEQFTITAAPGKQVRVDSLTFLCDFYNTISGIKMGLVYSKNGFTSPGDSVEFNSGVGPGGVSLSFATSGTFSKSFTLQRNDAGPVNRYAISLNGVDGVTLNEGETVTIRLYWGCGSTGTPRFAFLKDVIAKGVVLNPVPFILKSFTAVQKTTSNKLNCITHNEQQVSQIILQRAVDGVHFEKISSWVPGNKLINEYEYDDFSPAPTSYYRLLFKDADGRQKISEVVSVRRSAEDLLVFPNPSSGLTFIQTPHYENDARLILYNSEGKKVWMEELSSGTMRSTLNVQGFPKGIYQLQFIAPKLGIITKQLIVR